MSSIYDSFHRDIAKTRFQEKIISDNDFTYCNFFRFMFPLIINKKYVLDVGCGSGTLDNYLANLGYYIDAFDISIEAIRSARKSARVMGADNVRFIRSSIGAYRSNKKFDVILCLEVLEHCKDDQKVLGKLNSYLKKNGLLFISVPLKTAPLCKLGLTMGFDKKVGHLRRYDKSTVLNMLKAERLIVVNLIETEGILRNCFYVIPIFKGLIRFVKGPLVNLITLIDDYLGSLFGYSDLVVIARKK